MTDKSFTSVIVRNIPAYSFFGLFRFGPTTQIHIKLYCDIRGNIYHYITQGPRINYEKLFAKDLEKARRDLLSIAESRKKLTDKISKALTLTPLPFKNGPEPRPMTTTQFKEHKIKRRSVRGVEFVPMTLIPKVAIPPPPPPKPYEKMKTKEYIETDESSGTATFGDTSKIYGRQTHSIRKDENVL